MNENPLLESEQYLTKRMSVLKITDDMINIELYTNSFQNTDFLKIENKCKRYRIFEANAKGIGILLYSIRGEVHWFRTLVGKQKTKEYRQTRLTYPKVRKDSSIQKYEIPRGQPTLPFFLLSYYKYLLMQSQLKFCI